MSGDLFAGLVLASTTTDALNLASEESDGGPVGTFEILAATIAVDPHGGWETVQLRSTFVDRDHPESFPDPDGAPGGHWGTATLTRDAAAGLAIAADLARRYDLRPVPPGALALGLVWRPGSGAARALLDESELGHPQLLELLQDELLGTSLEGLVAEAAPTPSAPVAGGAFGDATTRRSGGGPRVPPPGAAQSPPDDPALSELLKGAETLRLPNEAGGPWLLRKGDRELTLYDLGAMRVADRRRIEAEAAVRLSYGEIPGAVAALTVEERGGWLVIETPRLGESLAEHLLDTAAGREPRLPAEEYARELAGVADTLQAMHDHGLVHGDLDPSKLRVDPNSGRLLLTEFALVSLGRGSSSDRFRAPEWFTGETGPSVDQYALGVLARDVFAAPDAPPLPAPLHAALQRATAPVPGDRFPTIADFGAALETAVKAEAPRRLSERVASRSPALRYALAPTAIAAVVTIAGATAVAPGSGESPELSLLSSLLLLALVAGFTLGAVTLAATIRGRRTFASLPFANRPLVPFVVFVVLFSSGFEALNDSGLSGVVFRALIFAYGGCALLAPVRADSGAWLVHLLEAWDRRRRWPARRRRAASLAAAVAGAAILAAPTIASIGWHNYEYPSITARQFGPLLPVWNFRIALDHSEYGFLCSEVLAPPASRPPAHCRRAAEVAAAVQRGDPATNRGPESFGMQGTMDSFRVQTIPAVKGLGVWNLLTPTGRLAGGIYTEGSDESRLVVMLSRDRARPRSQRDTFRSTWLYEVDWNGHEWRIIGYRACRLGAPGTGKQPADCAITSAVSNADLRRINAIAAGGGG